MKVRIHQCALVVLSIEGGRKGLRYTKGRDGGQEDEETKKGERTWNERESARARTKRRVQTNGRRGRDQDKHGGGGGGQERRRAREKPFLPTSVSRPAEHQKRKKKHLCLAAKLCWARWHPAPYKKM
jgi:hypothetical protein